MHTRRHPDGRRCSGPASSGGDDHGRRQQRRLYGDCDDYDYSWTVGAGARDWSLDVTLVGPDGDTARLTDYGSSYTTKTVTTSTSSFTLRRPRSRVSLSATPARPRFNGMVTLRAQVREEQRYGFGAAAYGDVRLEVRTDGGWRPVRQGKVWANSRGVAVTRYRWNVRGPVRIRARALPNDYSESYSRPITVTAR